LLGDAAEALFFQALEPKVVAVNARVSVPLYQGQFDATVSLVSNRGEGTFAKSTALKRIKAAQPEEVPAQIKRWNKAGGRIARGLERCREAELFRMRWYELTVSVHFFDKNILRELTSWRITTLRRRIVWR
jgi:GH24 family phage-related lysozyme (muramidase)